VFFLLLAFKNNHRDVRVLFRLGKFLLNLAHKFDIDVDILIWLKLALHWCDCKHLFSLSLLHSEIETDWILSLILQVERKFFWLTNTNCAKVKLSSHSIIERDVEGLSINLNLLFLLLNSMVLDVLNFKLNCFKEFLLSQWIECHFNRLWFAWVKSARCAQQELLKCLFFLFLSSLLTCHWVLSLNLGFLLFLGSCTWCRVCSLTFFLRSRWFRQSRCLTNAEFTRQRINASQFPIDWDSAGVSQDELLLRLLSNQSTFEFDNLLVNIHNWLRS